MKEEEVNRCQIQEWYPKFKSVSIRTLIHELPESFVEYLLDDSRPFLLPVSVSNEDALPNRVHNPYEEEDFQTICFTDDAEFVDPDPGHSFKAMEQQVFGSGSIPSMTGFVEQALSMSPNLFETVMKSFRPESVLVYASLVQEFAVFDRWFSSIPGPTQPNRLFVYSATSHGSTSHVKKKLAQGYL
ncbi:hypothetical protein LWI29_021387 [Acer saccharum]|uniref:Uncharacterized protein n=1 Tax=Acer saccharum TaxID=4024 RepID=A0AA39VGE1_ACESA|nr:hypothetical protein LWI29_021387 [Acer saccharum]